jgi:2-polyprenyl-3-methyl-5-hydroxy-6-metoxy-1,4-benzoquinol methylase
MSTTYNKEYNEDIRDWLSKVCKYAKYLSAQHLTPRDCPVCSSKSHVFQMNNDYLDYSRCRDCSLIFMNPTLDATHIQEGFKGDDALVMEYFRIVAKYRTPVQRRPDPRLDNKLHDIYEVKTSGRLLDIGCSFGDFLRSARYFYEVEGVEVNPWTAETAAAEFTIHRQYLNDLGLGKNYDIVTLHQILYGVPDPLSLLKDTHNVLKDNGILYINTPNADSYAMRLYGGKANHIYGYTTQNVFNRRSLEKAAQLTGFKIKTFRTEWVDIYLADLLLFLDNPDEFIHKKNTQLENYEEKIRIEEETHKRLNLGLADRGNYLVAILEKS